MLNYHSVHENTGYFTTPFLQNDCIKNILFIFQSTSRNSLASESLSSSSSTKEEDIFSHEELEVDLKPTSFGIKKSFLDPERFGQMQ